MSTVKVRTNRPAVRKVEEWLLEVVGTKGTCPVWEGGRKAKPDQRTTWQRVGDKLLMCLVGGSDLCSKKRGKVIG